MRKTVAIQGFSDLGDIYDNYDSLPLPFCYKERFQYVRFDSILNASNVRPLCYARAMNERKDQMTYAEWYQTVEKPRLASITPEVRALNAYSHSYWFDGDSERCRYCECAPHNGWKAICSR